MFDDLLQQFNSVISQAKSAASICKSDRIATNDSEPPFLDPTKKFGVAVSFPKSQRFKEPQKQQLTMSFVQSLIQQKNDIKDTPSFSFKKSQRFQERKPSYSQTYINPNFNIVKKNTTNNVPIYKQPIGKDLAKSYVSISTIASESLRGPGAYFIKQQKKAKNTAFSKEKRFIEEKRVYQDTPLNIKQSQTMKRPPSCALKKKQAKTKQLISKQQQQNLRQRLKMIYWKNIPLQLDRIFKNNNGPVLKQNYFNFQKLSGTSKRAAVLMMLDRLNLMRGGFEQNIQKKLEGPCQVVFRKSTPKPFKFSQMQPGPDYYYPSDDLLKPSNQGFTFGRQGMKEDYQIKEEIFKTGGNIIINPQHKQIRLTQQEIASLQRGPGFYDCIFSQVQKRQDVGVLKMQDITEKNARQNNCIEVKQVCDGVYFPSYTAIDPNVAVPLYKQSAQIRPIHIPDKQLFPEHWLFYDGDLNKVRAQIAKNVILAKNMSFAQYNNYKQRFNRFKEYLQIQKKGPEQGDYSVKFTAIDPHIPEINLKKMEQKTLIDPIVKPEGDYDGDNLILNPKQPQNHLPNIDFKKMGARFEEEDNISDEPKIGDRLILNPQKPQKHIANVNMQKQAKRNQQVQMGQEYQGPEGAILILNPKPIESHIAQIDFKKQANRPQVIVQKDQNQQYLVLFPQKKQQNPTEEKVVKRKVKGVPFSRLSSVKMVSLLRTSKSKTNYN